MAEVRDIADLFPLFEHDRNDLGMHLIVFHAVDDGAARLLQFACEIHIVFFVETAHSSMTTVTLLAVFARLAQKFGNAANGAPGDIW